MGKILVFPRRRDRPFVRRQAQWLLEHSHDAGERYIGRLLTEYAKRLAGRGVSQTAIENEIKSLEGAVRAEAGRSGLMMRGGAA